MIDCFGEQYNYEIVRYKDEKSGFCADVFGQNNGFESEEEDTFARRYPDDLEKMLYFIKSINKSSMRKVGTTAETS
jgi:SPX domain protein involved in polyphosphate accumulation